MIRKTTRLGATGTLKARKTEDHILLARGLSARLTGANTPLTPLAQDEMERDLRHMEAFANACTTYAQQYYIFQTAKDNNDDDGQGPNPSGKKGRASHPAQLIAMPVRIDPEEEKRLQNLRQKIQHCEAQREVYEGQYLSLRAHYIYLSRQLKSKREDVNTRVAFLQEQVVKRGKLVALQRVRLQILRDTFLCLQYRRHHKVAEEPGDLHTIWNDLEKEWKKAEENLKSTPGIMNWPASTVPKIPRGVPLLLSQLAEQPGQAAAWGTGGAFGAKPDSMVWIKYQVPSAPPDTCEELPALREEVANLNKEIERERDLNVQFQSDVIARRKRNDELVAMMALLRTETEAVVARHNILLESDIAKLASMELQEEEANEASSEVASAAGIESSQGNVETETHVESTTTAISDLSAAAVPDSSGLKEDDENDGDDEGGPEEEEDEGEILEDAEGQAKRALEGDNGSPRSKRRKL